MPKGMQAIYTQTVGAGGSAGITFNNIPQNYTDLKVLASARSSVSAQTRIYLAIRFNNSSASLYNNKVMSGGGSSISTGNNYTGNAELYVGEINGSTSLSNSFSTTTIDIPNYSGSFIKNVAASCVYGNNIQEAFQVFMAGIWLANTPITSFSIYPGGGNSFVQHSTFTLYGIAR